MQPARILPDLQASLLCEDVRQETSGNFIIIGVIGVIRVLQVPITAFKLCIFNRWTAGIGVFTQNVRIIAPDGITVLRQNPMRFGLQDASHHAVNVTVFTQIEFPSVGVYHIEILVDDVMKLRYPIPLVLQPPAKGAPAADTPPPTPTETQ